MSWFLLISDCHIFIYLHKSILLVAATFTWSSTQMPINSEVSSNAGTKWARKRLYNEQKAHNMVARCNCREMLFQKWISEQLLHLEEVWTSKRTLMPQKNEKVALIVKSCKQLYWKPIKVHPTHLKLCIYKFHMNLPSCKK